VKFRLFKSLFGGARNYTFTVGNRKIEIDVDENGLFEANDPRVPWHGIASIAYSKRDIPYESGAQALDADTERPPRSGLFEIRSGVLIRRKLSAFCAS
jgi:hypothetical protein